MKKLFLLFTILFSTLTFSSEDNIQGKWITEKAKNGNQIIVEFYQVNNKYFGKINTLTIPVYEKGHKLEGQTKIDLANPDENLKNRPLVGINFVSDFTYNPKKDRFENGFIYNPENGKTYYCSISFKDPNTLIVKGSLDRSGLIGSKQIWKKIK
ncbi:MULTISPECIES: DUF2147 domain-containing protein [Cetobacterium]|jgi:uncharacterized protein (DUF2147 family)|uniref:DUF2147 domain-containing protein n=1 Tax=Candidatus Cetobacterium colombiensis TaxID=3073100 RepID=A0ABU4WB95_9FUSO|nr:DUF2147 domain-containing protein [Candidatus Cetobacterium colombiensis]MDX8335738.1 DUF2147 domain-containing protein [Candidatus Cetobacterium colombiensis]